MSQKLLLLLTKGQHFKFYYLNFLKQQPSMDIF